MSISLQKSALIQLRTNLSKFKWIGLSPPPGFDLPKEYRSGILELPDLWSSTCFDTSADLNISQNFLHICVSINQTHFSRKDYVTMRFFETFSYFLFLALCDCPPQSCTVRKSSTSTLRCSTYCKASFHRVWTWITCSYVPRETLLVWWLFLMFGP